MWNTKGKCLLYTSWIKPLNQSENFNKPYRFFSQFSEQLITLCTDTEEFCDFPMRRQLKSMMGFISLQRGYCINYIVKFCHLPI